MCESEQMQTETWEIRTLMDCVIFIVTLPRQALLGLGTVYMGEEEDSDRGLGQNRAVKSLSFCSQENVECKGGKGKRVAFPCLLLADMGHVYIAD